MTPRRERLALARSPGDELAEYLRTFDGSIAEAFAAAEQRVEDLERRVAVPSQPWATLDAVLAELDGCLCVACDATTEELERQLDALAPLDREAFDHLTDTIERVLATAELDVLRATIRRDEVHATLLDWRCRAGVPDLDGVLREHAAARVLAAEEAMAAHEAELAEYRVTLEQVRAVHEYVMRRGYRYLDERDVSERTCR